MAEVGMADLTFILPFPPADEAELAQYLNQCRDIAWGAVGRLEPRSRRHWPTQEKVKCEVTCDLPHSSVHLNVIYPKIVDAIGGVLWHPKIVPMVIVKSKIENSSGQVTIEVTYRKLVSEGVGRHYEW